MMDAVGENRRQVERPLPSLAGNADGLRHRHLLQLRGENPRRRGRLGLPPHLRRRPGLRGRRRGVRLETVGCAIAHTLLDVSLTEKLLILDLFNFRG